MAARIVIETEDFLLQFSCANYGAVYKNADRNIKKLYAQYRCNPDLTPQFSFRDDDDSLLEPLGDRAFFFDNTDYEVFYEVKGGVAEPRVLSVSRVFEKQFSVIRGKIRHGTINFKNDIGKCDFVVSYLKEGDEHTFCFTFEVLSVKLDYHTDWTYLIREIEAEHQTLSLDFIKQTYHSFDRTDEDTPNDKTADMIWWSLFRFYQDQFVKASRLILNRPRQRVKQTLEYLRADQLRILTPSQENEFRRFRHAPSHIYVAAGKSTSRDTPENRFFKHAVKWIVGKYGVLSTYLLGQKSISDTAKDEIRGMRKGLQSIAANPFFRGIGPYKGLRQESLVLQRAPGYSTVYRIYAILKLMYALVGDKMRLETKDIATLYEMWCYIRIKNAVAEILGDDRDVKVKLNDYVYRLFKGADSKIVFDRQGIEIAEISYNSQTFANKNDGIDDAISPTTDIAPGNNSCEKPDIVLRITKTFGGDPGYKLTYLFDAKYRVEGRYDRGSAKGVDYPPQDAIDQLHRYRDAIYYQNPTAPSALKKEVVGGYVLFPGSGDLEGIKAAPFMTSRMKVNIGAFPLRPDMTGADADESEKREAAKNTSNNALLKNFLEALLKDQQWLRDLEDVIAHKGMTQILTDAAGADSIVRAPTTAGTLEAFRKCAKHVYPVAASAVRNPDAVRWIIYPRSSNPVPVLAVKKGGEFGKKMRDDFLRDFPDFASIGLPDGEYFYWEAEEITVR